MPNIIIRDKILGNPYVWKQTRDLLFSFTNKPTFTQQRNINDTVNSLIVSGLWAKHDTIWVMAAHSQQAGQINWKNPGQFTLTLVNSPTFTAFQGFAGDGATKYITTGWIASVHGQNFKLNNGASYVYDRTNLTESKYQASVYSAGPNSGNINITRAAGDLAYFYANDVTNSTYPSTDSRGLFLNNRVGAGTKTAYKNGIFQSSAAVASVALPTLEDYILGCNANGSLSLPTSHEIAIRGYAGGLTTDEQMKLYNIWQKYMTNMNTQV